MSDFNAPWLDRPLNEWSIVGMNHYQLNGERRLFVAMTKDGQCIQEEGPDDKYLWNRLWHRAQRIAHIAALTLVLVLILPVLSLAQQSAQNDSATLRLVAACNRGVYDACDLVGDHWYYLKNGIWTRDDGVIGKPPVVITGTCTVAAASESEYWKHFKDVPSEPPQAPFDGRCPTCVEQKKQSRVYGGWCRSTLLASLGYYDEQGTYHYDDPNITTCDYQCSNGHRFSVSTQRGKQTVMQGATGGVKLTRSGPATGEPSITTRQGLKPLAPKSNDSPWSLNAKLSVFAFATTASLDCWSTGNLHENNPLLRNSHGGVNQAACGAINGTALGLTILLQRNHPKVANWFRWIGAAGHGAAFAHNEAVKR